MICRMARRTHAEVSWNISARAAASIDAFSAGVSKILSTADRLSAGFFFLRPIVALYDMRELYGH